MYRGLLLALLLAAVTLATASQKSEAHTIQQIIWSPDGEILAIHISESASILLYDANRLVEGPMADFSGVSRTVFGEDGLAISLDEAAPDKLVVWSYTQPERGILRMIEGYEGDPSPFIERCHRSDYQPSALALHPNGQVVATDRNDGSLVVFNLATGGFVSSYNDSPCTPISLAYNVDGTLIGSTHANGDIQVFSTRDGALSWKRKIEGNQVYGIAFSPRGDRMAVGVSTDNEEYASLRDLSGNLVRNLSLPSASLANIAFSPDGELLAAADRTGNIGIFDVDSGELLAEITEASGQPAAVAFSPDGVTLAYSGAGGILKLWDVDRGEVVETAFVPTLTASFTATVTPTPTAPLPTDTPTLTLTPIPPTVTNTASGTATHTLTSTPTLTLTSTRTASHTPTWTSTATWTTTLTYTPTATRTATPTATPLICPGTLPTRLRAGMNAVVRLSPPSDSPQNLRVRATPGGETIGSLIEGTRIYIIGDGVCGDGVIWYPIETLDGQVEGWSAEGVAPNVYYIQPEG
jgi:WD40 repeat protein